MLSRSLSLSPTKKAIKIKCDYYRIIIILYHHQFIWTPFLLCSCSPLFRGSLSNVNKGQLFLMMKQFEQKVTKETTNYSFRQLISNKTIKVLIKHRQEKQREDGRQHKVLKIMKFRWRRQQRLSFSFFSFLHNHKL